jgi:hypothetical protein
MFDLRSDGIRALQQDDIESARSILEMVPGQILGRQLDQLLLLPLMDGMDRSAERVGSTRFHLDKDQHLTVFSH